MSNQQYDFDFDVILKSQMRRDVRDQGLARLLYAVLDDALRVIQEGCSTHRADHVIDEAIEWVASYDRGPFSFHTICVYFDIDVDKARAITLTRNYRMPMRRAQIGRRLVSHGKHYKPHGGKRSHKVQLCVG